MSGRGSEAAGSLVVSHRSLSPNGLRLSGERSGAERVRCSRGFGESWLMSRGMARRYAFAGMLFNVSGRALVESVETKGTGASAAGSRPAPARTERVHDVGAGHTAGDRLPGPSRFSRVAERLKAQRRAREAEGVR